MNVAGGGDSALSLVVQLQPGCPGEGVGVAVVVVQVPVSEVPGPEIASGQQDGTLADR